MKISGYSLGSAEIKIIVVCSAQALFFSGGAEILVESMIFELR